MRNILILLLSHLVLQLHAQSPKKDTLGEVIIRKKIHVENSNTQTIDSNILNQYQNTSLQNVLQLHSNVFVKNYGVGALSTISIRGSSAAQTAVLWHGMNINNAMSGIADFSILPVSFFDKITINYSGNQANALAGNIELNQDKPIFRKRTEIHTGIAYESLQNAAGMASVLHSNTKFIVSIKGFYQESKNIFKYYHTEKEKFENLTHADSKTKGLLADLYVKLSAQQTLGLHLWTQETKREIPPALFEKLSTKNEINQSTKAVINYDITRHRWSAKTEAGFMKDKLNYTDSLIRFSSQAEALTIPITETLDLFPSTQQKLSIQASAIYSKLLNRSGNDLQRASASLHYEVEPILRKLFIKTFLQKEYTNVFSLPLIAGIHVKEKIYKENYIVASVSSNYRTPTLNELYFMPGGNVNLKPETSRNLEGGIENRMQNRRHSFKSTATVFTRNVENWIVWYGGAILTPHNIQKVWSRGLEVDLNYRTDICGSAMQAVKKDDFEYVEIAGSNHGENEIKKTFFNLHLLYSYTLSTTKESAIANDYSIDKQIPYVPRYQLKLDLGLTRNAFDINYVYAYTGYRFVTTDESEFLLPYNTHNIFTSYKIHFNNKNRMLVTFRVNNILNQRYESIVGRVMPGRSFSVGLSYSFRN